MLIKVLADRVEKSPESRRDFKDKTQEKIKINK